jgi:hypothetical protein
LAVNAILVENSALLIDLSTDRDRYDSVEVNLDISINRIFQNLQNHVLSKLRKLWLSEKSQAHYFLDAILVLFG